MYGLPLEKIPFEQSRQKMAPSATQPNLETFEQRSIRLQKEYQAGRQVSLSQFN
jgi:hypothetical protein